MLSWRQTVHFHTACDQHPCMQRRRTHTHTHADCPLHPYTSSHMLSHFRGTPEIQFCEQKELCTGRRWRERQTEGDGGYRSDRSWLNLGLNFYHNRRPSQQEALWCASMGQNRELFTPHSSIISLIHFYFSLHPRPCLSQEFSLTHSSHFFFGALYIFHFLLLFSTSLVSPPPSSSSSSGRAY